LLDLRLADASGASILTQLRDRGVTLPFIVVTGQGDERVAVEMMKQGALDYVIKDAGMLDRLPHVVGGAFEKLANRRALAAAEAALIESEKRILAVSERERQRIGADLHDNLGQQLTAIELLCHSLREDLHNQPGLEQRMAKICRFLQESVAQTRQLARGLTPVSTSKEGLEDSLAEMARRMSTGKIRCEFIRENNVEILDNNVATHLYRVAQEAVNNALKHADASVITITLGQTDGTVILKIADDGRGFSKVKQAGSGIGLEIMHHRATIIGAVLETQSHPAKGVIVTCTLKSRS
jgi:signal transduction histidine kinase